MTLVGGLFDARSFNWQCTNLCWRWDFFWQLLGSGGLARCARQARTARALRRTTAVPAVRFLRQDAAAGFAPCGIGARWFRFSLVLRRLLLTALRHLRAVAPREERPAEPLQDLPVARPDPLPVLAQEELGQSGALRRGARRPKDDCGSDQRRRKLDPARQ